MNRVYSGPEYPFKKGELVKLKVAFHTTNPLLEENFEQTVEWLTTFSPNQKDMVFKISKVFPQLDFTHHSLYSPNNY